MNNDCSNTQQLCFFPYIGLSIVAIFFFLEAAIMFFLSFIVPSVSNKVLLSILAFIAFLFSGVFFIRIPVLVVFTPDGILLRNILTKEQYFSAWNQFVAAYCMYGSRGHTYLLLACTEMNISEQKKCWKKLQQLSRGKPVLASDGNICILADRFFQNIKLIVQEKLPFFLPEEGPRVG